MRCYSHLSDDEREQIGLAKAVGHSIGAIAKAIGRPKSTVSRELSRNKLPSGAIRGSKEIEPYGPSLSTGSRKGGPRSKFQAGSRAETNLACGPWVARRSTPSSTGQRNRPSSYGWLPRAPSQTPPPPARRSRASQRVRQGVASPSTTARHVEARTEGGHWEDDLVICKRTRPVLVSSERNRVCGLAARLAGRDRRRDHFGSAGVFAAGSTRHCAVPSPSTMVPAFAQRSLLRTMRAMTTSFCERLCLMAKGRVENADGRLRALVAASMTSTSVRPGNPGRRRHRRSSPQKMPWLARAIFWSWLWGPIGLILSMPLTLCLVVCAAT